MPFRDAHQIAAIVRTTYWPSYLSMLPRRRAGDVAKSAVKKHAFRIREVFVMQWHRKPDISLSFAQGFCIKGAL